MTRIVSEGGLRPSRGRAASRTLPATLHDSRSSFNARFSRDFMQGWESGGPFLAVSCACEPPESRLELEFMSMSLRHITHALSHVASPNHHILT